MSPKLTLRSLNRTSILSIDAAACVAPVVCDELHASCTITDETWDKLKSHFIDAAIIEILMLAGRYPVVSYLTNAIRMPLETWARRLP